MELFKSLWAWIEGMSLVLFGVILIILLAIFASNKRIGREIGEEWSVGRGE